MGWLSGAMVIRRSLVAVAVDDGPMVEQGFAGGKIPFPTVAQTVGLGLGRLKMLDLSMGID
jgi:hypothetical protein